MVTRLFYGRTRGFSATAFLGLSFLASPALANSSNADISAPLRVDQAAHVAQPAGDQEFRQLFSSWRALDKGAGFAAAASGGFTGKLGAVSIPSRMPVDGFRMTSNFGMRMHPILHGWREHKGVDLADPVGTPVFATADGYIGRADWFSGYGLFIQIEHGGAIETRYGHMSRLNVAAGQFVHKGDVIGYVGATGRATGPHLHYEVRVNGVAVNPLPYMQGTATGAMVNEAVAAATMGAAVAANEAGDD